MYVAIRFTEEIQADRTSTAGPADADRLPRGLLFLRDDSFEFDRGKYGSSRYVAIEIGAPGKTAEGADPTAGRHLYRQVRRVCIGSPANSGSIFFITTCEMEERESERFLKQFDGASTFLKARSGFLGFRLLKNCDAAAPLRFINIAHWLSMATFEAAFSSATFKTRIAGASIIEAR